MIIIHAPLPNFKDTDFTLQASNKHGKIITPDTKSSNSFPLSLLQKHNNKKHYLIYFVNPSDSTRNSCSESSSPKKKTLTYCTLLSLSLFPRLPALLDTLSLSLFLYTI